MKPLVIFYCPAVRPAIRCVLCCIPTKFSVGPEVQEELSATQRYGNWTHQ